jgi:hypothetical protein
MGGQQQLPPQSYAGFKIAVTRELAEVLTQLANTRCDEGAIDEHESVIAAINVAANHHEVIFLR